MGEVIDMPGFKVVQDNSGNTKLFKSRKEDFEDQVTNINCSQYMQCPICYKCMCKAGHMYEQCERCPVPLCHHNQDSRTKMIRPKNFTIESKGILADSLQKNIDNYEINHGRG